MLVSLLLLLCEDYRCEPHYGKSETAEWRRWGDTWHSLPCYRRGISCNISFGTRCPALPISLYSLEIENIHNRYDTNHTLA